MSYIVFVDLDDTLLNHEKRISDDTLAVLLRFQSSGNHIVFATARSRQLHGLQDNIKTITPHFIFHNGGEIVSSGTTIYQGFFSPEETACIGSYLTDHSLKAAVILDDAYYANYDAPSVWGMIRNFNYTSFADAVFQAPKFSVLLENGFQADALSTLNGIANITFIDDNTSAIIAPKDVSKGSAARIMLSSLFPNGKSVFIGNDSNDLSGFEACDLKVAVANAEPVLLAHADIVIESNDDDGVAKFLNSLSC